MFTLRELNSLMGKRQTLNKYMCAYIIMNYDKCSEGIVQDTLRGLIRQT